MSVQPMKSRTIRKPIIHARTNRRTSSEVRLRKDPEAGCARAMAKVLDERTARFTFIRG